MQRIPRRIFTAEFKREAIKLVTEQGLTFAEASRELGIAKMERDILKKRRRSSRRRAKRGLRSETP